ncbi:MAG TPA: carboxypeptidase, partial [Chthonomonadaceae bacterium]|nr:carboxypeptidase [Chthonomonadaceae bacterium]
EWAIWHALLSPRLELHSITATRMADTHATDADGLATYLVRLVVDNTGWLPTYISKKALEKKVVRALVVELELPEGAQLQTGKTRMEVGQLEGRAYKAASPYGWAADPTAERAKVEWVLRAAPGSAIKLTARHERAGILRTEATLT